jgi:hypothetical protein
MVKCYEHAICLILEDGVRTAVALNAEALSEAAGLVGEARQIVNNEQNEA